MSIGNVFIRNFRLFENYNFHFSHKNLLLTGPNGSGKTSLLEALCLLLTGKSFKTRDLGECIREGETSFLLGLQGLSQDEKLTISLEKALNKRVSIKARKNNKPVSKNKLPICLIIQAKDLRMLEGEPELRRGLFKQIMFHVKHESYSIHQEYKKVLIQRNMALKKKATEKELSIWTSKLIEEGKKLEQEQKEFFKEFYKKTMEIFTDSSQKDELSFLNNIKIKFYQGWSDASNLEESINNSILKDRALGYTTQGPHRLDLKFYIKDRLVKSILSRGQQKLLILLIYFKMNVMLNENNKIPLIYLIDDITSELDEKNLRIALEHIISLKTQVVITSTKGKEGGIDDPILDQFKQINL